METNDLCFELTDEEKATLSAKLHYYRKDLKSFIVSSCFIGLSSLYLLLVTKEIFLFIMCMFAFVAIVMFIIYRWKDITSTKTRLERDFYNIYNVEITGIEKLNRNTLYKVHIRYISYDVEFRNYMYMTPEEYKTASYENCIVAVQINTLYYLYLGSGIDYYNRSKKEEDEDILFEFDE